MDPIQGKIGSAHELNQLMPSNGPTVNFINRSRASLMDRFEKISFAASVTFGTAGFLAGFAGLLAISAAAGAAVATMVTPVGWAALGVAAIAVLILLARHVIMAHAKENPHTLKALIANISLGIVSGTFGILCYVSAALFDEIPSVHGKLDRFKVWLQDFWVGYSLGSLCEDIPLVILGEGDGDNNERYLVYKDDHFIKNHNGQIIISAPPLEDPDSRPSDIPFPL